MEHLVLPLSAPVVMSAGVFSLAWFTLGLLAGRRLPKSRRPVRSNGSGKPPRRGGRQIELYVGNLSYDVNDRDMRKAFSRYGKVVSVRVISNKFNGKSRGFGFVEMATKAHSEAAVKGMNGKELKGRKVVVNEAK